MLSFQFLQAGFPYSLIINKLEAPDIFQFLQAGFTTLQIQQRTHKYRTFNSFKPDSIYGETMQEKREKINFQFLQAGFPIVFN